MLTRITPAALTWDVEVWQGEDRTFTFGPIRDGAGDQIDFTGMTITSAVTAKPGVTSQATATGSVAGGGATFTVTWTDTQLGGLSAGKHYWEVLALTGSTTFQILDSHSVFLVKGSVL